MVGVRRWIVVAMLCSLAWPVAAGPSRLPVDAFAKLPEYADMDLSPSGARLAAIVSRGQTSSSRAEITLSARSSTDSGCSG